MDRFLIAHIFFFTAFMGLLGAAILVVKNHRHDWKSMVLVFLPMGLIFLTAYLGKTAPWAHQIVNLGYDILLIFNTAYFWKRREKTIFWLYVFAVFSTILDFAMHSVIRGV